MSADDRRTRRMARADKLTKFLDPAASRNQASAMDAYGGTTGRLREVERDYKLIRLTEELLEEQRATNALLRELLSR